MDTANKHDDENEMEVYVHFIPSNEIQIFKTPPTTTIRDLKILSEEKCGIPSDLLTFMHNAVVLDDNIALLDLGSSEYAVLDLFVDLIWEKFVNSCFKGENDRIMARVHIKMNQLSPAARAFVAAFTAAHEGNSKLFQLVIESFKEQVMFQTVGFSGRSLLHAAVLGENISCVMTFVINGGWKLLYQADKQQEVPLDMAQRMKKEEGLIQILTKYNDMYIHKDRISDRISAWESSQSDETITRDSKETELHGYASGQDEKLPGNSVVEEEKHVLLPKPPTKGKPEESLVGRGQRLLQRSETPRPKLHIPAPGEQNRTAKYPIVSPKSPTRNQVKQREGENCSYDNDSNIRQAEAVQLPIVNEEGSRSPLLSPKNPQREFLADVMSRRGSLQRHIRRARSPSSPTLPSRMKHPPRQTIERPRAGSLVGEQERRCNVQMRDSPPRSYLSSSAPNSPILLRQRKSLPLSSLACPRSPTGCRSSLLPDQVEHNRIQANLMAFQKTRETLPWNVWKAVSLRKAFEEDDSSTKSHGKEAEEEMIRTYRMSGHRKSFEVWLADKEHEKVKRHTETNVEAKRLSELKALEEMQRRVRAKSFDEWLKEKEASVGENTEPDVTEAERQARRAQASLKYQQWMKKKDEAALAREEMIRAEEQRKYEKLKKKRDEEERVKWLKKPLGKVKSVPV